MSVRFIFFFVFSCFLFLFFYVSIFLIGHYGRLDDEQRLTRMNNLLKELMRVVTDIMEIRVKAQYKFNTLKYYVDLEGGIYHFVLHLFNSISKGFDLDSFASNPK